MFDHHHPKIITETFSFPEFISTSQKSVIPLIAVTRAVLQPKQSHSFLTIPTPIFVNQLLISRNMYQHAKNRHLHLFVIEV